MRKVNFRCRWIGKILVFWMLLAGWGSHALAAEQETPVIRVGYTDKGQMILKDEDEFVGYGVAYLQKLAEYTGWQYVYVPVAEESRIEELNSGNIDLLCDVSLDEAGVENLILSQENSCIHYALLCAKEDDTSVFFDEFEAMDNKRIAINESRRMASMMEKFADEHSLTYTPVYCSSFTEMEEAVSQGKADLLVASNQRETDGLKYVAKIGLRNQYFAVSPERADLMEQINEADRQIKLRQPFWIARLYEIYYGRPYEVLNGTTREEYSFIKCQKPVRVVCDADSFPVEYIDEETGKYSGIYADAMALIEKESGLCFEYIPVSKYGDAWKMLQNGEAEMSAGMYLNESLQEKYGLLTSTPHITASYTMILRSDESPNQHLRMALPENYVGIQEYVREHYPEWEIVPCKDNQDGLEMADSRRVDGTIINAVFLQTVFDLNSYHDLVVQPMHSMEIPISCAFAGPDAKLLAQIVNKAIYRIPAEAFENCTLENAVKVVYEPNTRDILRRMLPFLLLVLVLFVLAYLAALWLRERRYRHLAMTDALTGLWNGRCFRKKAGEVLAHNEQKKYQMVSFDLHHFKYVNSDLGEKAADCILQGIGERLKKLLGNSALYAREMSDVFLILTESRADLNDILHDLGEELQFEYNGLQQSFKPELKFGICNIPADADRLSANEYIDRAMTARKSIKRNPTQQIASFDHKMAENISREIWIEKKMEEALKQREFVVYYQPKYCLSCEKITGAEALVRWNSPEEGMIYPNDFIPVFERNGFIIRLDFFVYEEALKTIARWRNEGRTDIVISVNVSRAHIGTGDFLPRLIELADRYQVPHQMLELELTETVLGGKRQDVLKFIQECKQQGFPISIDDFGSGYSSLNLLKDLPVDVLKIDREFLNETEVSEKSSVIIAQIVDMATKLHICTLCEGVETEEQEAFLEKIGCGMAQGYLYSKPVPLEAFEELLKAEHQ